MSTLLAANHDMLSESTGRSSIFRLPANLIEAIIKLATVDDVLGGETPLSPTAMILMAVNKAFYSHARPVLWRRLSLSGPQHKLFALFMTSQPLQNNLLYDLEDLAIHGHSPWQDAHILTLVTKARLLRLRLQNCLSSPQMAWQFCSTINVSRLTTIELAASGSFFPDFSETACWQQLLIRSANTLERLRLFAFRDSLESEMYIDLIPGTPLTHLKSLNCAGGVYTPRENLDASFIKWIVKWAPNLLVLRVCTTFSTEDTLEAALQVSSPRLEALGEARQYHFEQIAQMCPNLVQVELRKFEPLLGFYNLKSLPASIHSLILSDLGHPYLMQSLADNLAIPTILPNLRTVTVRAPGWVSIRSAPDPHWYREPLERLLQSCEMRNIQLRCKGLRKLATWRL